MPSKPPPTHLFVLLLHFLVSATTSSADISASKTLILGNSTLHSPNRTFELGFFTVGGGSTWYLGIWYASITIRTYVWVANRRNPMPAPNAASAAVHLSAGGRLAIFDLSANRTFWQSQNTDRAVGAVLLDTGNLVLLSPDGRAVWQSFDSPADTWLPGMALRCGATAITSWRSPADPSPGRYALQMSALDCGEIELVHLASGRRYWSTGNWTGAAFANVPEMMVEYIYAFNFSNPFTPQGTFLFTEKEAPVALPGQRLLLTRFSVDSSGELRQFTWSPQTENWDMFWSRPDNLCGVYGLCGTFGLCRSGAGARSLSPCDCLPGYHPENLSSWLLGDFSAGCRRSDDVLCGPRDSFVDVGSAAFDDGGNAVAVLVPGAGNLGSCKESCLSNCSCIGLNYNSQTGNCQNLYGDPLNFRNLSVNNTGFEALYVRVGEKRLKTMKNRTTVVVIGSVCGGALLFLSLFGLLFFVQKRMRTRKEKEEEEGGFPATNLKVFSYKELQTATRGFSEKLGHGGFGAVFMGELLDSTPVAVKRLERPGGAEREFRAEVCTIGNIQHVNLVRLRGFCSENSHRLLVYDYMENGPLSVFLRRDGPCLSWAARFRIAIGTARGIAYLHEECRHCIIHCDIKPENILLDGEFAPKVSDFGLAKLVGRDFSRVMTTMRGTWGYVAPEWISGVAITAKADVYSYGMTLLEMIGGRRNVEAPPVQVGPEGAAGVEERWFFPPWATKQIIDGNFRNVVDPRLGGEYSQEEVERVALVAVWCIQDEEAARPSMGSVVKMLEGTVEVAVPPAPQLLQALVSGDSFPEGGIGSGCQASPHSGVHSGGSLSDAGSVGSSVRRNLVRVS